MDAKDAAALYGLLTSDGRCCWVVGGWGIDALLGRQTRQHKDLDVLTLLQDLPELTRVLAENGFARTLVWEENRWLGDQATAFVAEDGSGRQLDVHVMETPTAPAWDADWPYETNALNGHGVIAGTPVACATAAVQILWHEAYELPPAHAQDLRLLREQFQISDSAEELPASPNPVAVRHREVEVSRRPARWWECPSPGGLFLRSRRSRGGLASSRFARSLVRSR